MCDGGALSGGNGVVKHMGMAEGDEFVESFPRNA